MVRQGLPLIAATFALFKLGAVPVVIDPGMGLRNFLACVARSRPRVLLGVPSAWLISRIFRKPFRTVEIRVAASTAPTARLAGSPQQRPHHQPIIAASFTDTLAAILFTSGSTGAPKGVCYEHGMFDAQVRLIRDTYGIEPGEIDLPLLPVFALFNPALGMTTIVPEFDPRRPAAVHPDKIVQAIQQEAVTNSFGSPTIWRKIADHCLARRLGLPSLRRVLCAGAPVPASLWMDAPRFIPNGKLLSPYGATEVLPVSTATVEDISPASVRGTCVGKPPAENRVKIIAITDGPVAALAAGCELPRGEIGEIIVTGPTVTREYDQLPEATRLAKIPDSPLGVRAPQSATVWHRMGDCGYLDAEGRLWFCGRVSERVETADGPIYTEPCEQVFRTHPWVARCALIGLGPRGRQTPAVVVEPKTGRSVRAAVERQAFADALRLLALRHPHTAGIRRFYFHSRLPVDVRHNAKIHRLSLARWAATAWAAETTSSR
jgi:acyl-CoA synthetase (AMP-forming)/AMP-acid ligase II